MKCKVRLTHTVELVVDGKNEDIIMDWIRQTTPEEAYTLAKCHVNRVDYDDEIVCKVREDAIVDYVIKEDNNMELKFIDNNKAAILSGDPTMDPGFDEYDVIEEKEKFKMTHGKLKELMKQHCISKYELDDVIDFVAELLYFRRKELEDNEPYATRTIDILFNAEREVYDLTEYISELEEDEQ